MMLLKFQLIQMYGISIFLGQGGRGFILSLRLPLDDLKRKK